MPFHKAIPKKKDQDGSSSGFMALVEAEKLMQIAFVLPSAVLICWAGGWWLARATHIKWIEIAGVLFGCVTGLFYVIQTAIATEKKTDTADKTEPSSGKGSPNSEP
jgi:F0F1-type ATP synthase assembly protein I